MTTGLPATAPLPHLPGNRVRRRKQWMWGHRIPSPLWKPGIYSPAPRPAPGPLSERPQGLKMATARTLEPDCVDLYPISAIFLPSLFPSVKWDNNSTCLRLLWRSKTITGSKAFRTPGTWHRVSLSIRYYLFPSQGSGHRGPSHHPLGTPTQLPAILP